MLKEMDDAVCEIRGIKGENGLSLLCVWILQIKDMQNYIVIAFKLAAFCLVSD